MNYDPRTQKIEHYLSLAMEEAEAAAQAGDTPYGAIIVAPDGEIIATGRNRTSSEHDPSSHAEMNAVRAACHRLQTNSLNGYWLFTNGAPCTMCATVMIRSGVTAIWYSAPPDADRTMPTIEELIERTTGPVPVITQGILAEQASAQLARLSL